MGRRAANAVSPKAKVAKVARGKASTPAVDVPVAAQDPLTSVIEFLGEIDLPATCRQMLQAAAPFALSTPKEQRHDHQASVVRELGDLYARGEQQRRAQLLDAKAAAARHEEEAATAKASLEATTALVKGKAEAKEAREAACAVCEREVAQAQAALEAERAKAASIATDKKGEEDRRREFADSREELWEKLKSFGFPSKDWRARNKAIARMVELLDRARACRALKDALAVALKTPASERLSFAEAALEHAEAAMKDFVELAGKEISELDAAIAEQDKAIAAAEGALAAAREAHAAACQESIAAQNEWVEQQSKQFEQTATVNAAAPTWKHLAGEIEAAAKKLERFTAMLAHFRSLADKPSPQPEAAVAASPAGKMDVEEPAAAPHAPAALQPEPVAEASPATADVAGMGVEQPAAASSAPAVLESKLAVEASTPAPAEALAALESKPPAEAPPAPVEAALEPTVA